MVIEVMLVRRSTGIEVTAKAAVSTDSDREIDVDDIDAIVETFLTAIERADGVQGYKEKKRLTGDDKDKRKAYAIAANKDKAKLE